MSGKPFRKAGQASMSAPSTTAPPRQAQSRPFSFRARSGPSALATVMEGRLQILFSGERTHRIIREAERLEPIRIGPDADCAHHASGMALRAAMGEEQLPMAACAAAHRSEE